MAATKVKPKVMSAASRQPLAKAIHLLAYMVDTPSRQWGVRELGRAVGLAPTTVHRILNALTEEGMMRMDSATSRYELGAEFFRLALKSTSSLTINQAALPYLAQLVEACNETAFLSVFDRAKQAAIFVASVESSHALRYVVNLHEWMPVHIGASGLAILAFLPPAEQQAVLDREVGRLSHPAARRWRDKLEMIRNRGYAQTIGERVPGAVGIAAPIFGPNHRVVGDVGFSIPEQRFSASRGGELSRILIKTSDRISRQLSDLLAKAGRNGDGLIWSSQSAESE